MIDKKVVENIAHLARLSLSDAEKESMVGQLDKIVGYVEQLTKVDTNGVEPTSFVVPEGDHLRDDKVVESLSVETALSNGPSIKKGHFAVPKVIG